MNPWPTRSEVKASKMWPTELLSDLTSGSGIGLPRIPQMVFQKPLCYLGTSEVDAIVKPI